MSKPGGLLAAISEAQSSLRNGSRCGVEILFTQLSEADIADLRQAFDDVNITTTVIGRILRERGHRIGDDSIRRHRRKACSCPEIVRASRK